ncbi:MAG: glutathione S-transferase N-terminal domain-containing protein [Gammaproteobacteria bacterium]|nr:glutathione S-transferase N-terminal domain-containing protein [Gammaproteobacteria bacterium]
MKLYGHLTSPYVRKVRIALREKNLRFSHSEESPHDPGNHVADLNPLGKVPVLETGDGRVLFDSGVIVEYLDQLGAPRLIPEGDLRLPVLQWHALGSGIVDAVVARLLEGRRPPAQRSQELIEAQEQKVRRAIAWADKAERGRAYLIGERFTLADLALGLALEYVDFRYPHDWRSQHPRLAQWLAGISTRGSFAETVPPGMEKILDSPH